MAKKEFDQALTDEFRKTLEMTKIIDIEVDKELKQSFIDYAMCVNRSRAIPAPCSTVSMWFAKQIRSN